MSTIRPKDSGQHHGVAITTPFSRMALAVLAIITILLIFAPAFLSRSLLQDLILIFLLIAMAQCWNLLAGYAGLISVGQQAFVGLGGYALFALILLGDVDPLLAVFIVPFIVALLSIPIGAIVFRMQGAYFAVVTWVVAEVLRLVLAQWKALGGGTGNSLPRSATSEMIGLEWVTTVFSVRNAAGREIILYWAALFVAVLIVAIAYRILTSRLGLALSAIRDGEVAAESVGVNITRTKFAVYVFAAFGTSLAGGIYFLQTSRISPDAAFSVLDWTAYVIFIVVIGGIRTIEGPIVGVILFVILQDQLAGFGPWYLILLGVVGVLVMLVAPRGLWGVFSQRTHIQLFPTRRRLVVRDPTDKKGS